MLKEKNWNKSEYYNFKVDSQLNAPTIPEATTQELN